MFSPEKMAKLFASSFLEQEPKVVLPKLQIYNATDFLSHDEQFSFKLNHIIDSLKNNRSLYQSTLNKLLAEKQDFFETPEIDAWALFAEGDHTSWLLVGAFTLSVIGIALAAILFVKLKTMSAALILLRQPVGALAVAGPELMFDYFLDVVKVNHSSHVKTNTTARLSLEICDTGLLQLTIPYAMFAFITFISVITLAATLATYRKYGSRNGRVSLWVQIMNKTQTVELKLLELGLFQGAYEFNCGEPTKWPITMGENRFCKLTMKMRGFQSCGLRDKIRQEIINVPKNVKLSITEARKLRQIVPFRYSMIIYLQTGDNHQILAKTRVNDLQETSIYQEPISTRITAPLQLTASAPAVPVEAQPLMASQKNLYPNLGKTQVCYLNGAFNGRNETTDDNNLSGTLAYKEPSGFRSRRQRVHPDNT
jgi:hypothetical protein